MERAQVFLGSSRESVDALSDLAYWIAESGAQPILWRDPGVFLPGDATLERLLLLAGRVDAAILVFGEDDKIWYRDTALSQARDNVLIEYGLFAGALGNKRVIVCRKGTPKSPSDLAGIVHLDLNQPERARIELKMWLNALEVTRLAPEPVDALPAVLLGNSANATATLLGKIVTSACGQLRVLGTSLAKRLPIIDAAVRAKWEVRLLMQHPETAHTAALRDHIREQIRLVTFSSFRTSPRGYLRLYRGPAFLRAMDLSSVGIAVGWYSPTQNDYGITGSTNPMIFAENGTYTAARLREMFDEAFNFLWKDAEVSVETSV